MVWSGVRLSDELEDCREGDRSVEERDGPDAEDLMHCDIETEAFGIVGYENRSISQAFLSLLL